VTNIEELKQWQGDRENSGDTLYSVATYAFTCTAHVRTTLRRALELQPVQKVWQGDEYANCARAMVTDLSILPDVEVWRLTKFELLTIHRALDWRKAKREAGMVDLYIPESVRRLWARIEDEIYQTLREIWHSEGKYWM